MPSPQKMLISPQVHTKVKAWLYAPVGRNFLTAIRKAALSGKPLKVVSDQSGSPTSAADLAQVCLGIAPRLVSAGATSDLWGVTHCVNAGQCSRYEFANAICEGTPGVTAQVQPSGSVDWPTAAPRPRSTPLDCTRLRMVFGHTMRPWRMALAETLQVLAPRTVAEPA